MPVFSCLICNADDKKREDDEGEIGSDLMFRLAALLLVLLMRTRLILNGEKNFCDQNMLTNTNKKIVSPPRVSLDPMKQHLAFCHSSRSSPHPKPYVLFVVREKHRG